MAHKHKMKIAKVFEHPVSSNIDVKKLLHALEHYGCKIEHTKNNKAKIFYGEHEFVLPLPHGDHLEKDAVISLRHFLETIGLTPDKLD